MSDDDNRLFDLLMNKKEDVKEEEQQSSELKDILEDLDSNKVPKLKSTMSTSTISPADVPVENITAPTEIKLTAKTEITKPPAAPKPVIVPTKPPEIPKSKVVAKKAGVDSVLDEKPSGEFFQDMQIFFKQLERAYAIRYDLWDNTTLTTLNILRRMNENIEQNTMVMIGTIEELHKKITKGLKDFEIKRNEIERFSDVDFKLVSKTFKKTLELLNFQVREFKLQQSINSLYNIYLN